MKKNQMRILFTLIVFLLITFSGACQTEQLAKNYFDRGEFEKALHVYEDLNELEPGNPSYFFGLIATYQQLERFAEAQKLLEHKLNNTANSPHYLVELGYNFQLQNKQQQAEQFYNEALSAIESRPNFAFSIGRTFEKYSLLDNAVTAYELGLKMNPGSQYSIQLARLYGEQGKIDRMLSSYLDVLEVNPELLPQVSNMYGQFITEDPANEANTIFRTLLLKRLQQGQNVLFNEMLSWLFIQQKDFEKAFQQEKAIYRRSQRSLGSLMRLTVLAHEAEQFETALAILEFIIAEAPREEVKLQAHQLKLETKREILPEEELSDLQASYEEIFIDFGKGISTVPIQIDHANFIAFDLGKKEEAVDLLKVLLKKDLPKPLEASVKMELADILVLGSNFNQALIYYSQVQNLVENAEAAQLAGYKVAKTSYFKGDFEWAGIQLDVLKSASSQLIANDAMELSLLIEEHSLEDTAQAALKLYARADLLSFQNQTEQAIGLLDTVLGSFKGQRIEDDALMKQALLFEETGQYKRAEANYLKLVQYYHDGIIADNAHFKLAELYLKKLGNPEKAREFYEKIIFNYPDSIYFVEARKKFRQLRGDNGP